MHTFPPHIDQTFTVPTDMPGLRMLVTCHSVDQAASMCMQVTSFDRAEHFKDEMGRGRKEKQVLMVPLHPEDTAAESPHHGAHNV